MTIKIAPSSSSSSSSSRYHKRVLGQNVSALFLTMTYYYCCCSWVLQSKTVSSFQLIPNAISHHSSSLLSSRPKLVLHSTTSNANSQNTQNCNYDLTVIGAGPVGVQAAILAASNPYNKRVCLVDAPRASGMLMNEVTGEDLSMGGPTGLFSKALRDTSKHINVSALRGMGLREESVWNEIIGNCVDLASSNAQDVMRQLTFAGVDYMKGFASFPDGGSTDSLFVTNEDNNSIKTVKTKNVLIATGSKPFRPGGIPFDGRRIFDSDSINQISYLPKSIAITGSGIIAFEFAKIFRNLGADVTLIIRDKIPRNALSKIGLDKDVAAILVADLVRSGIRIQRGTQVKEFDVPVDNPKAPIRLLLEGKGGEPLARGQTTELTCEAYLAAVGRIPNAANLNLLAAGDQGGRLWWDQGGFESQSDCPCPECVRGRRCRGTSIFGIHRSRAGHCGRGGHVW